MNRLAVTLLVLTAVDAAADARRPALGISLPRGCRDRGCVRERALGGSAAGPSYAEFEFAPADGAGMGTVCACAAVTGAKGETLTFTRASSGTCLKGATTAGIANGDMVACTSNQPRVMSGGAGPLGLLVEESRTNTFLRSNEFDNPAWTKLGQGGAATPTVTADQAVCPDGTTTADEVAFGATTAVQRSVLYQVSTFSGAGSTSVFVKSKTTGDTFDVCTTAATCTSCTHVAGSWTLCKSQNGIAISAGTTPFIGNASSDNGGVARNAQTVYLCAAQYEAGSFSSSYIATTSAAATRAVDTASLPFAISNATASIAATIVTDHTQLAAAQDYGIVAESIAGPDWKQVLDFDNTGPNLLLAFSTGAATTLAETLIANTPMRWATWWDGSSRTLIRNNGGTATGAAPMPTATTLIEIGSYGAVHQPGFVIKQVCVDTDKTRCR